MLLNHNASIEFLRPSNNDVSFSPLVGTRRTVEIRTRSINAHRKSEFPFRKTQRVCVRRPQYSPSTPQTPPPVVSQTTRSKTYTVADQLRRWSGNGENRRLRSNCPAAAAVPWLMSPCTGRRSHVRWQQLDRRSIFLREKRARVPYAQRTKPCNRGRYWFVRAHPFTVSDGYSGGRALFGEFLDFFFGSYHRHVEKSSKPLLHEKRKKCYNYYGLNREKRNLGRNNRRVKTKH